MTCRITWPLVAGLLVLLAISAVPALARDGDAIVEESAPSGRPAIHVHAAMDTVSIDPRHLALEGGLERLLRHSDTVLIYASAPDVEGAEPTLTEVHVYPGAPGGPRTWWSPLSASPAPVVNENNGTGRGRVARELGRAEERGAAAVLADALRREEDAAVRERLVRALGRTRSDDAIAALAEAALSDLDDGVREAAVGALGKTWSEAALGPLLQALDDGRATVRAAAAEALGRTWSDEATGALARAAVEDPSARVREGAVWALSRLGTEEATASLVAVAHDPNRRVRNAAREVLAATDTNLSAAREVED